MRIRVVKPDYWSDAVIASLPEGAARFYIGLWMVADDTGWLKWQSRDIAALLYPYKGVKVRERRVQEWFDLLTTAGRVILHPCGHAVIPTFTAHQRTGGSRTTRVRDSHLICPNAIPKTTEESGRVHTSPDKSVRNRNRKGREGKEGSHLQLVDGEWVPRATG